MNLRSKLKKLEQEVLPTKPQVLFVYIVGRKDYNWVCHDQEFNKFSGESDQQFQDRVEKIILNNRQSLSGVISICTQSSVLKA